MDKKVSTINNLLLKELSDNKLKINGKSKQLKDIVEDMVGDLQEEGKIVTERIYTQFENLYKEIGGEADSKAFLEDFIKKYKVVSKVKENVNEGKDTKDEYNDIDDLIEFIYDEEGDDEDEWEFQEEYYLDEECNKEYTMEEGNKMLSEAKLDEKARPPRLTKKQRKKAIKKGMLKKLLEKDPAFIQAKAKLFKVVEKIARKVARDIGVKPNRLNLTTIKLKKGGSSQKD